MSQTPTFQTVRLARGRHRRPAEGVCVMELASMLAGERFSDKPRSVCPINASFLRPYNDLLDDDDRDELHAYASLLVGSRTSRATARRRVRHLAAWTREHAAQPQRVPSRFAGVAAIGCAAGDAAAGLDPARRREAVERLVEQLMLIGAATPPRPVAALRTERARTS